VESFRRYRGLTRELDGACSASADLVVTRARRCVMRSSTGEWPGQDPHRPQRRQRRVPTCWGRCPRLGVARPARHSAGRAFRSAWYRGLVPQPGIGTLLEGPVKLLRDRGGVLGGASSSGAGLRSPALERQAAASGLDAIVFKHGRVPIPVRDYPTAVLNVVLVPLTPVPCCARSSPPLSRLGHGKGLPVVSAVNALGEDHQGQVTGIAGHPAGPSVAADRWISLLASPHRRLELGAGLPGMGRPGKPDLGITTPSATVTLRQRGAVLAIAAEASALPELALPQLKRCLI